MKTLIQNMWLASLISGCSSISEWDQKLPWKGENPQVISHSATAEDLISRVYPGESKSFFHDLLGGTKKVLLEVTSGADQTIDVTLINQLPLSFFEVTPVDPKSCHQAECDTDREPTCRVKDQIFPDCSISIHPGVNLFRVHGYSVGSPARLALRVLGASSWIHVKSLREGMLVFCFSALFSILIYQIGLLLVESRVFIVAHICAGWSLLGLLAGFSGVLLEVSPKLHDVFSQAWASFAGLAVISTSLALDFYLKEFFFDTKRQIRLKSLLYLCILVSSFGAPLGNEYLFGLYAALTGVGVLGVDIKVVRFLFTRKSFKEVDFNQIIAVVLPPFLLSGMLAYWGCIYKGHLRFDGYGLVVTIAIVFLYSLLMSIVFGILAGEQRMKVIRTEEALELGRNVQDLLIERSGHSVKDGWDLVIHYEPYLGRMSGDWIMRWETPDGSQHLLFGDVTGKGPQAALTVAMVASVVSSQARNQASARLCIEELNKALFHACNGSVSTTASGISYNNQGMVSLINCAGPGWLIARRGKCEHWLGRGGILGLSSAIPIESKDFHLRVGDFVVGVTDGIGSSLREMRHVAQVIERAFVGQKTLQDISRIIVARPSVEVISDDKAMICFGKNAA